jgi:protein gp37
MSKTPIEWVLNAAGEQGHTINPIRFRNLETGKIGHHCEKISPGCKNCYASTMNGGPYLSGLTYIAENTPKGEYFLDSNALQQVLRRKKPTAYFWCDMTDLFGSWVPEEWIDQCFAVMALTPQHRHFVLTKRADRMLEYFAADPWERITLQGSKLRGLCGTEIPMPNVWLGVSVEDQQRANERYAPMKALAEQGWITWVSYEPALESVAWWGWSFLKWLVVGGESGPGARPFNIAWARNTVKQCGEASVPVFVKQLGAFPVEEREVGTTKGGCHIPLKFRDRKGGDMSEWTADLRVRQMPEVRP